VPSEVIEGCLAWLGSENRVNKEKTSINKEIGKIRITRAFSIPAIISISSSLTDADQF
jgi:hypothetical protein